MASGWAGGAWSLAALASAVAGFKDGWNSLSIAYGTFRNGAMVTAAILGLSGAYGR